MNRLLFTLSFLISLTCLISQSWALPPCPTSGTKHNCYGKYTFPSGNIYIGEYQNGVRNGQGIFFYFSGDKYEGEYKDGKKHGQGIYTWVNPFEQYVGKYKNGKMHGQGTYTYANGDKYVGGHKDGESHGQGTYTYTIGDKYVGEYKDNKRNGQGTYTYADGEVKEGIWKNSKFMYEKKTSIPSSNSKIEEYKSFCSEIGFTPGTEKFGECVVEAMKKG
jgi:hypothetical protein